MCWLADRHLRPPCEGEPMVLELPDVRQASTFGCGEAAARTVAQFWGSRLRKILSTPIDGTDPRHLEAALWNTGLSVQSGGMDVGDLKYHTGRGRPVICLVTEAGSVGHYVVVGGVRYNTVFYQCGTDGPCREPVASFEGRWRDVDRMGVLYLRWGLAVGG